MLEDAKKEREKGLKQNPRYDIDLLSDGEGNVRLYFHSMDDFKAYMDGEEVVCSTERFLDDDIFRMVPKDDIQKITDGGTLAHLLRT